PLGVSVFEIMSAKPAVDGPCRARSINCASGCICCAREVMLNARHSARIVTFFIESREVEFELSQLAQVVQLALAIAEFVARHACSLQHAQVQARYWSAGVRIRDVPSRLEKTR